LRYRTTKCPFCGYKLEDQVSSAKELIGPPLVKCPSCHHLIKTGMKYWKDFSSNEKIYFWISWVFSTIYSTLFISVGGIVLIFGIWSEVLKKEFPAELILPAWLSLCMILLWVYYKKQISLMVLKEGERNNYTSIN